MSNITGMQQKTINFGNWLADLITVHVPDCEEKTTAKDYIGNFFDAEENYNNFMFSIVPGVCGVPRTKESVVNIRKLKDKNERELAVTNALTKLKVIKALIDTILNIPPEDLDAIVLKLSLYVNLFTDMYFQ